MSGVAFERIHSHKYKAIRYMLRDADWAILQGSDRWATDQDRLERFAELAEARVTHKQARKSTSAAERSSSTTEYHNPTSLAYLWGAAAREIRNSAISCGESRNGKEITALTLGTTGSRLATASCLAVAGYEMDREMDNMRNHLERLGILDAGNERPTFDIPLTDNVSALDAASPSGAGDDAAEDEEPVTMSVGEARARRGREAAKARLEIGKYLDDHRPPPEQEIDVHKTVRAIAATERVMMFDIESYQMLPRTEEQILDLIGKLVTAWNEKTKQWPAATREDPIRVGSRGDIFKLLDEEPGISPVGPIMRPRVPKAPSGAAIRDIYDLNDGGVGSIDHPAGRSGASRQPPTPAHRRRAHASPARVKRPHEEDDGSSRALKCLRTDDRTMTLFALLEQSLASAARPPTLPVGVETVGPSSASFTLADRDLGSRVDNIFANTRTMVSAELQHHGPDGDKNTTLSTSPSLSLCAAYKHIFDLQGMRPADFGSLQLEMSVSEVTTSLIGSFIATNVFSGGDITASFGFDKWQESDGTVKTHKESYFDAELAQHHINFAHLSRRAFLRSLSDPNTVDQVSAIAQTMIKYHLAAVLKEHIGSTHRGPGSYDDNIGRWTKALTAPLRNAAIIACEMSCGSDVYEATWITAGQRFDAKSMKGIERPGQFVAASVFPGSIVKRGGGRSEMECRAVVKAHGVAVEVDDD